MNDPRATMRLPCRSHRRSRLVAILVATVCTIGSPDLALAQRPLAVRVEWGGGQPRPWSGRITVVDADSGVDEPLSAAVPAAPEAPVPPERILWRTLSTEPDAAAGVVEDGLALVIRSSRPTGRDGVELVIPEPARQRLVVDLRPQSADRPAAEVRVDPVELLAKSLQMSLDADGNRLTVAAAGGEPLRVEVFPLDADERGGARGMMSKTVFRPGQSVRCLVEPWLQARGDRNVSAELRMRVKGAADGAAAIQSKPLAARGDEPARSGGERRPLAFEPVSFDLTLPEEEGACEVEFEAVERAGLGWSRSLATRTVQVVAVADAPTAAVLDEDESSERWKLVYELDPGSPKLHERLRRLPGGGLPSIPLPAVPLPSLTRPGLQMPRLPSVPLPQMSLPQMSMPQLPMPQLTVPQMSMPQMSMPQVPSVSSLVPRLSGLQATGHSRVESHPLGPMLRLPAAPASGPATWEAVLLAGVQPGRPHVVEIDLPGGQGARLATSVLELDASATVQQRHAGGVALERPLVDSAEPQLFVHRFIFWPTTRSPLLVLANDRPDADVLFGRVRVRAGPDRLAPAIVSGSRSRRVHGFLAEPDFRFLGSFERSAGHRGRSHPDWTTHLTGIVRSAQYLQSQAAAGALVTVYARGAAAWPSALTRQAARWDCGGTADHGLDPAPKDLLAVLCRVYGRERLTLVPAVSFDGGLPALEELLARGGDEAVGVACVGRDGRPRRTPLGGVHYNPLDPRVQDAVVAVVTELVGRVAGETAVDQVAVILGREGWLHLPGVDSALDDATFARFLGEAGVPAPATPAGSDRFAARAAAVAGPLRAPWLAWRTRRMTELHERLADAVAGNDSRLTLALVPTTLFDTDDMLARFRWAVPTDEEVHELLAEHGLDPGAFAADEKVVFVWPSPGEDATKRGVRAAIQAATAGRTASGRRRGVLVLEQSRDLDLRHVLSHTPFGAAVAPEPCRVHAVTGGWAADRGLAEALAAGDAERVFDSTIWFTAPEARSVGRAALAALPGAPLGVVRGVPTPLVARARRQADGLWMQVINPTAAPGRVVLALDRDTAEVAVVSDRTRLPLPPVAAAPRRRAVDVDAWGMRTLWVSDPAQVEAIGMAHERDVHAAVTTRVERLRRQRRLLESPRPLEALDNPGFDLGGDTIAGWELLDSRQGSLDSVTGGRDGSRAAVFRSPSGLATLRSNPFPRPSSGRVGIAAWLRLPAGAAQPPLRIALEGSQESRDFYRFAPVGGADAGRPLAAEWSQYVLHVDDLPAVGPDTLRVRFDLLGTGGVEIDDVRVYDLALDAPQLEQVTRIVERLEERLAAGDIATCLAELDGPWPRYLDAHLSEAVLAAVIVEEPVGGTDTAAPAARQGARRLLRWW